MTPAPTFLLSYLTTAPATSIEDGTLSLSHDGAALLANIRLEARRRGIRLVYILPWAYAAEQSAEIQRQANSHFLDQVEAIMPVICEPLTGVHIERQVFADSGQYLTYQAAKNRSVQLRPLLKQFNKASKDS